ncbi:NAD(P)-dependent oxidoreductase [Nitratireductor mangrovi]|uniref:NAD(P)-dependent oxidoreductase n=1 Tax=Nitratireductor mangrovi TaxID=2599600 RepID=A0A5B8KVS2_9HYPH|nr:NAD(P)-dependent oxidoreductase [Nitratireductor mangrovi]QDY99668.1 NAD(P)-dependent oxidoreductase [Nitratireductor mangrovi]
MPQEINDRPARLAFIGFGEAASAFLAGWGEDRPAHVAAFDIKTDDPALRSGMHDRYRAHDVAGADALDAALDGADVVFSVVTADQALAAARAAAPILPKGSLWLDCNSCAPDTKRQAAEAIEAAGGSYVDVAVMAPVHPKRHKVPLLVSGPHAAAARTTLLALGMCPEIAGEAVGQASAIKMIRSVMIKGLEALTAECFLAARRAGVEESVFASLQASDPDIDWRARTAYNLERMTVHGARRAAEMREVAATVAALGLPNGISAATALWQDHLAGRGGDAGEGDAGGNDALGSRLDAILARL